MINRFATIASERIMAITQANMHRTQITSVNESILAVNWTDPYVCWWP